MNQKELANKMLELLEAQLKKFQKLLEDAQRENLPTKEFEKRIAELERDITDTRIEAM